MPNSWAAIAAAPAPLPDPTSPPDAPSPEQLMQEVRDLCSKLPKVSVLLYALGFDNLAGVDKHVAALLEHTVVIGIDTEAWTKNTDEMTEVGLVVFERKDMVEVHARKATTE